MAIREGFQTLRTSWTGFLPPISCEFHNNKSWIYQVVGVETDEFRQVAMDADGSDTAGASFLGETTRDTSVVRTKRR
eukprot:scaffold1060_cov385-Pavlova_lutheri.AAC.28